MVNYRLVVEWMRGRACWLGLVVFLLALPVTAETLLEQLAAEKASEKAKLEQNELAAQEKVEAAQKQQVLEEQAEAARQQALAEQQSKEARQQALAEEVRRREEARERAEAQQAADLPPGHYALTVNPVPANARVRIMNIKEKYEPGIELKPGHYRIKVDHRGYMARERWVTLDEADMAIKIKLKEKVVSARPATNPRLVNEKPVPAPRTQSASATAQPQQPIRIDGVMAQYQQSEEPEEKILGSGAANKGYAIQILVAISPSIAEKVRGYIAHDGYPAFVVKANVNGKIVYRVRIGTYSTKEAARAVQNRMKARYTANQYVQNSFVTRN